MVRHDPRTSFVDGGAALTAGEAAKATLRGEIHALATQISGCRPMLGTSDGEARYLS